MMVVIMMPRGIVALEVMVRGKDNEVDCCTCAKKRLRNESNAKELHRGQPENKQLTATDGPRETGGL